MHSNDHAYRSCRLIYARFGFKSSLCVQLIKKHKPQVRTQASSVRSQTAVRISGAYDKLVCRIRIRLIRSRLNLLELPLIVTDANSSMRIVRRDGLGWVARNRCTEHSGIIRYHMGLGQGSRNNFITFTTHTHALYHS